MLSKLCALHFCSKWESTVILSCSSALHFTLCEGVFAALWSRQTAKQTRTPSEMESRVQQQDTLMIPYHKCSEYFTRLMYYYCVHDLYGCNLDVYKRTFAKVVHSTFKNIQHLKHFVQSEVSMKNVVKYRMLVNYRARSFQLWFIVPTFEGQYLNNYNMTSAVWRPLELYTSLLLLCLIVSELHVTFS